jgi:hypothetical protein
MIKILNFFKKDNMLLGIALGAVIPVILYYILSLSTSNIYKNLNTLTLIPDATLKVVSIVLNVFIFRHYMLKLQFDRTGKGILLSTFIYVILFFIFES